MDTVPTKKPKFASVNALHQTADYSRLHYHLVVEPDVTLEDILLPGFWTNQAPRLKAGDLIDVVTADYTLDVQLRVTEVEPTLVHVRPRLVGSYRDADAGALDDEEVDGNDVSDLELPDLYEVRAAAGNYYIRWKAPTPAVTLEERFPTKREAYEFAIAHDARNQKAA